MTKNKKGGQGRLDLPLHLAGGSFKFYLEIIWLPILAMIVFDIIFYTVSVFEKLVSQYPCLEYLPYYFAAFVFFLLILIIFKKITGAQLLVAAIFTGLIAGLLSALFKLIWFQALWTVFNLIIEPIITALIGLVIDLISFYTVKLIIKK